MKITREILQKIIEEETKLLVLEGHGLSDEDIKKVEEFIEKLPAQPDNIKSILKFLVKSNVKVDKTQDVTKMKDKEALDERYKASRRADVAGALTNALDMALRIPEEQLLETEMVKSKEEFAAMADKISRMIAIWASLNSSWQPE